MAGPLHHHRKLPGLAKKNIESWVQYIDYYDNKNNNPQHKFSIRVSHIWQFSITDNYNQKKFISLSYVAQFATSVIYETTIHIPVFNLYETENIL
jgi:hypothetical protein